MLPLHREHRGGLVGASSESDGKAHSASGANAMPLLLEAILWGAVAECLTSLCFPLRSIGNLDMTGTALNLGCPVLSGMAFAIDEAAAESGADPGARMRTTAFQVGFIGVATSFSFMAEQAAWLQGGWFMAWLYILGTFGGTCVAFALGRTGLGRMLRARRISRLIRTGRLLPSPTRLRRVLLMVVAVAWAWVLLAPAGIVFEPLAVHRAAASRRALRRLASSDPAAAEAAVAAAADAAALLAPKASKRNDVLHLAVGLGMQAAGLVASARIEHYVGSTERPRDSSIRWAPLVCNVLACAVVIVLRVGEVATLVGGEEALFASKLRTSGCGALSVCGGLGQIAVGAFSPREHLAGADNDVGSDGASRSRQRVRGCRAAAVNLTLHAQVAVATCALLPMLTDWVEGRVVLT